MAWGVASAQAGLEFEVASVRRVQFTQEEVAQVRFLRQLRIETLQTFLTFAQHFQLGDQDCIEIGLSNWCGVHKPVQAVAMRLPRLEPLAQA